MRRRDDLGPVPLGEHLHHVAADEPRCPGHEHAHVSIVARSSRWPRLGHPVDRAGDHGDPHADRRARRRGRPQWTGDPGRGRRPASSTSTTSSSSGSRTTAGRRRAGRGARRERHRNDSGQREHGATGGGRGRAGTGGRVRPTLDDRSVPRVARHDPRRHGLGGAQRARLGAHCRRRGGPSGTRQPARRPGRRLSRPRPRAPPPARLVDGRDRFAPTQPGRDQGRSARRRSPVARSRSSIRACRAGTTP